MAKNNFINVVFLQDRAGISEGTTVSMDRPRAAHYLRLGVVMLADEPDLLSDSPDETDLPSEKTANFKRKKK